MDNIKAKTAYFIKLGRKGAWEERCILQENIIQLGFINPLHQECLEGNWDVVYQYWLHEGKSKGKATEIKNQIKTFYESDEHTLWITFFRRRMYWGFAERTVTQLPDGTRIRKIKEQWRDHDIQGHTLSLENLSGKLTQVQGFQGTICSIKEFDYLLRRINHQKLPEVQQAEKSLSHLLRDIEPLIRSASLLNMDISLICKEFHCFPHSRPADIVLFFQFRFRGQTVTCSKFIILNLLF